MRMLYGGLFYVLWLIVHLHVGRDKLAHEAKQQQEQQRRMSRDRTSSDMMRTSISRQGTAGQGQEAEPSTKQGWHVLRYPAYLSLAFAMILLHMLMQV